MSHIIPEFMYKGMYDATHRFLALSSNPSQHVRFHQKGLRERLLCEDCEGLLNRFESYTANVFYGNGLGSYQRHGDIIQINGLDYKKLKLFLLSLLWRFGVTTLPQLVGAKLGPHAEHLRAMLLAGDPGEPMLYRCILTVVTWDGKHEDCLIVPPCRSRIDGRHIWLITVAGIVFTYFVSSEPHVEDSSRPFVQKNGSMAILIREIRNIDFLRQYISETLKNQRSHEAISSGT